MIEHLQIDVYEMGVGGTIDYYANGEIETYMAIREQLYAQMMGFDDAFWGYWHYDKKANKEIWRNSI